MQLEEANPKNGFLMAKQGLSKRWKLKDQNWSHLGEEETVEREREEQRREEEEEEEDGEAKVWMLDFAMNFIWTLGILA